MYKQAAEVIKTSSRCVAFTGAGISVESGIPPFRGENGLWNKYDPETFDISYFHNYPETSWKVIKDIFYELFGQIKPNSAHYALAELEANGMLNCVITQNVDNLHYDAGSRIVHEFHGSLRKLLCLKCKTRYDISHIDLSVLPPVCNKCGGILKPNVIFFGEAIPKQASVQSFKEAGKADCFVLIGTTGTVAPANTIPYQAKANGATIIEINPYKSEYTASITDIFLKDNATVALERLMDEIDNL